jgi:hypothetical protein
MREVHRGRFGARLGVAAFVTIASLSVPGTVAARAAPGLGSLPTCYRHERPRPPSPTGSAGGEYQWRAVLDARG